MLLALRLFVDLFIAKWENYSRASTQQNVTNNVEMLSISKGTVRWDWKCAINMKPT